MSWTNEGTYWRRPLDCHDRLFQSISAAGAPLGREHWLMFGWLELAFPTAIDAAEQEQRLRKAWGALRLCHPDVALTLHEDEKRYVPLADEDALQDYVSKTFHVETGARCMDEFFTTFKLAPSEYAACYWLPASNEVVTVSPHWRWDGLGRWMMLNTFMELLADIPTSVPRPQPDLGAEAANLVPSLDSVLNVDQEEVHQDKWLEKADQMLAPFTDGSPALGLPITSALPKDSTRVTITLPEDVMSAVLAACRKKNIRFTAALHASIVSVTQSHAKPVEGQDEGAPAPHYKSWAAFNLRKQCPPPADGPAHAVSLRLVALPMTIDPTATWGAMASAFQSMYGQRIEPSSDTMSVRVPYVEKATSFLAKAPPSTEPNLSSIGNLDGLLKRKYGDIEVVDVNNAIQMLSPQLYVHSWGWAGKTKLSICYNEAFYEKDFVRMWLDEVKADLFKNLEVEG